MQPEQAGGEVEMPAAGRDIVMEGGRRTRCRERPPRALWSECSQEVRVSPRRSRQASGLIAPWATAVLTAYYVSTSYTYYVDKQ